MPVYPGALRFAHEPSSICDHKLVVSVVPAGANLAWQPMNNREIQAAWKYHDGTKHSSWSVRNHPHFLDWANRPMPFKIYPKIEPFPLPRDVPVDSPSPESEDGYGPGRSGSGAPPLFVGRDHQTACISRGRNLPLHRSLTGALYEIELYVMTGDLPGLDAGVYRLNPADVSLRLLGKGDFFENLAQATPMEPAVAHAPATIICAVVRLGVHEPEHDLGRQPRSRKTPRRPGAGHNVSGSEF